MSTNNYSSRPRTVMLGVNDKSTRSVPVEEIVLPQHLPYMPIFGQRGNGNPYVLPGSGANRMYGSDSFDVTKKYATHMTPMINLMVKNGNVGVYQRMIPPNATKAMIRVSVEVIPNTMSIYARNSDGSIKYTFNDNNEKLPVVTTTITGHRLIVHTGVVGYGDNGSTTNPINYQNFGQAITVRNYRPNTTTGVDGTSLGTIQGSDNTFTSTLYPIFDLPVFSEGSDGNNQGLRLQLPTTKTTTPIDSATAYASNSYLWRLGLVAADTTNGGYSVTQNENGSSYVDVSLKLGARTDRTNTPITVDTQFITQYITDATASLPAFPAAFDNIHVYRSQIEELQNLLINGDGTTVGEAAYNDQSKLGWGRVPVTKNNPYLLNFLGAYDIDGIPYHTFEVASSANFGGITVTSDNVIYASGGSDGLAVTASGDPDELANALIFDQLVQAQMTNFATGDIHWTNRAKYPVSAFWDSGYSVATKQALLTPLASRQDVAVILATQSVTDYVTQNVSGTVTQVWSWISPNNEAAETALAGSLRTQAAAYPESLVYGTDVCRVLVVGQCGTVINNNYGHKLPLTYELANKVSKFMGAPTWDGAEAWDDGNNIIDTMTDINLTWKTDSVAEQDWANGLIYAEDYDINRLYFPAICTVYGNDTSVLHSGITMFAVCVINRAVDQVNRTLQGNSKWTDAKFIQQSNDRVAKKLNGIFDNRFIITVDTVFTQVDKTLGYSWNTNVSIYANNMRTVGNVTITSDRMDAYNAQTDTGVVAANTTTT